MHFYSRQNSLESIWVAIASLRLWISFWARTILRACGFLALRFHRFVIFGILWISWELRCDSLLWWCLLVRWTTSSTTPYWHANPFLPRWFVDCWIARSWMSRCCQVIQVASGRTKRGIANDRRGESFSTFRFPIIWRESRRCRDLRWCGGAIFRWAYWMGRWTVSRMKSDAQST